MPLPAGRRGLRAGDLGRAEKMLNNHPIEAGVVAIGDELVGPFVVERSGLLEQVKESAAAVLEMRQPMLDFGRAEGMNVEADALAVFAVTVALEGPDLIKGDAQIGAAERFVLIELEAVLIVKMKRPELAKSHGEIDFIGGIEAGKNGMRGLDQAADTLRICR